MSSLWRLWTWATWRSFKLDTTTQVRTNQRKKHNQYIVRVLNVYFCYQEVHLAGFWTGSRLTPPLRDRNYVSHVAAGWIKERMMVQL